VRRFNFFKYRPQPPLDLQLNPDVTVRTKGVMEKCSFCVQRIKEAHQRAKVEGRSILDGEVVPACAQTCPTGAITFGSFLDPESRIRRLAENERAYQVLAELLTKPGVIYLKKIVRDHGLEKA
jgi:molybdopterin-containing oxidoreductase family iron-sulfur binding subunit